VAVPTTVLSSQGVYDELVRLESHHDIIQKVSNFAGLQTICEPRSLESGGFPGVVVNRARQGRDVDYELTEDEITGAQLTVNAEDVADLIIADAVGIADPKSSVQITAQALNVAEADKHAQLRQVYIQISDITDPNVARQQLEQQVYLAASPWEEVAAAPDGRALITDTFPLPASPDLKVFGWEPGDAPRLTLPTIGVVDTISRQLMSVEWPFSANGFGRPNASWRARPRNDQRVMRTVYQAAINQKRTYQGQLTTLVGTLGGSGTAGGGAVDLFSRVVFPRAATVVRAEVIVMRLSTTPSVSAFTIEVNGVATPITLDRPGTYDVTGYATKTAADQLRMYAQLTGGGGSTYGMVLQILAAI